MLKYCLSKLSGQPAHHAVFSRHGFLRCRAVAKPWARFLSLQSKHQHGFSLLEMLVVIGLLSIVAASSAVLLIDDGDWKRQEGAESNWSLIKKAIINENVASTQESNGLSGFVVDMGRLPNCLRELVRPLDCNPDVNAANQLPLFQHDVESSVSVGWRGPYLGVAGANEFRDGWGNQGTNDATANDDSLNYGWVFGLNVPDGSACVTANTVAAQTRAGELYVRSCGINRQINITDVEYSTDYPPQVGGNVAPVVVSTDYQVSLGSAWVELPIKINSSTVGASIDIPANSLRARLNYPVTNQAINGILPDWTDTFLDSSAKRDRSPFLSLTFPTKAIKLPDAMNKLHFSGNVTVPVGSTLVGTDLTVPNGVLTFSENTPTTADDTESTLQNCPCLLTINSGNLSAPTIPPTPLILSGASEIKLQPQYISPLIADFGKSIITVPANSVIDSATQVTLPNGATLTFNTASDFNSFPILILGEVSGVSTVTVSEAFNMTGNTVVTTVSVDHFIVADFSTVAGNTITVDKTIPSLPVGQRSVTIVCELDGFNFDGDCLNNAVAGGYKPIAAPYRMTLSPRVSPVAPNSINWNIE